MASTLQYDTPLLLVRERLLRRLLGQNPTGPNHTGCLKGDCRVLRGGAWDSRTELATTTVRLFYGPTDSRPALRLRSGARSLLKPL